MPEDSPIAYPRPPRTAVLAVMSRDDLMLFQAFIVAPFEVPTYKGQNQPHSDGTANARHLPSHLPSHPIHKVAAPGPTPRPRGWSLSSCHRSCCHLIFRGLKFH